MKTAKEIIEAMKIYEDTEEMISFPMKELDAVMSKVFNILLALEEAQAGDINFEDLIGLQKTQGYEISSHELREYFLKYGVDIE